MSDEKINPNDPNAQAGPGGPEPEPVDTWYDDEEGGSGAGWRAGSLNLCGIRERMRDEVIGKLPVDVTQHLVNSHKELLKAGIALAETGIRKADQTAQRAKDLHTSES